MSSANHTSRNAGHRFAAFSLAAILVMTAHSMGLSRSRVINVTFDLMAIKP
jgi:hypothetical protein